MTNDTDIIALRQPESMDDPLTGIARDGARRMLAAALRAEADTFGARAAASAHPWQHLSALQPHSSCDRSPGSITSRSNSMIRLAAKASISRTRSPSACCATSSSNAILSSVIVISVFGFECCNPNLCRRTTVAASVTTGRAARATPGAPRAASYTTRWDTAWRKSWWEVSSSASALTLTRLRCDLSCVRDNLQIVCRFIEPKPRNP